MVHLGINMCGMWVVCTYFASQIRLYFLFIYFVLYSAVSSFFYFYFFMPVHAWLVGASGGVYALIGFLCWFQRRDRIFFLGLRKLSLPFLPAMLVLLGLEFLIATFWIRVLAWQLHIIAFSISIFTAMAVHAVYALFHWLSERDQVVFKRMFERGMTVLQGVKRLAVHIPVATEQ